MFFSSEVRQNIKHWKREEDSLELNLELSGIFGMVYFVRYILNDLKKSFKSS